MFLDWYYVLIHCIETMIDTKSQDLDVKSLFYLCETLMFLFWTGLPNMFGWILHLMWQVYCFEEHDVSRKSDLRKVLWFSKGSDIMLFKKFIVAFIWINFHFRFLESKYHNVVDVPNFLKKLIYSDALVSDVQQTTSVLYTLAYVLFQVLFLHYV